MSRRTERISRLLLEQISSLIFKIKKPLPSFVTITEVTVSPDIKNARVYYSVMDEASVKECQMILESSVGFFSRNISRVLRTKNFPRLEFEYDPTPRRAARVFEIFEKLAEEEAHDTSLLDDIKKE